MPKFLPIFLAAVFCAATIQAQEQKSEPKTTPKPDTASKSDSAATGNVDDGKKLFMANGCFECHGTVGQGASQTGGARIGPPAISQEELISYVRHPSGQMPPYTNKVISDQNLADIYAYLKSQPKPPSGKNIPLLNQ